MSEKEINAIAAKVEFDSCLLCQSAPCTKACPHGIDPANIIFSMRFDNMMGASVKAKYGEVCASCKERTCLEACIKKEINYPVQIPELLKYTASIKPREKKIKDKKLEITFCGVTCENPFFLSSSVVASNYEMVAKAYEMGWAGMAFKTIGMFVPEEVSPRFTSMHKEGNSFVGFKNIEQISDHTLEENLDYLKRLKKDYPSKIIIASIMGTNEEEWTCLAKMVTEVGADIIECNFSCPHMAGDGLGSDVGQNPELVAKYTKATRRGTSLPILAKMTPNIGNMEIPALAAISNGADGIAAINTIKSIMNINLDDFSSEPQVDGKSAVGGYSGKTVKPIALRFIHDMKKHPDLKKIPISGMGGIETWRDAAEFIAIGCENIQITTAVMQYGYRIIDDLISGMTYYLEEKGFSSLKDMVGNALPQIVEAETLNRKTISYPKFDRKKCIGCNRCYISCFDGGHQAIIVDKKDQKPRLLPNVCVGCHLCSLVCPVKAISPGKRVKL